MTTRPSCENLQLSFYSIGKQVHVVTFEQLKGREAFGEYLHIDVSWSRSLMTCWPVDLCPLYFTGLVGGKGGPVVINCGSSPLCNSKVRKGGFHIWCVCTRCWRATTASPVSGVSFILWCAAGTHFSICFHPEMKLKGAKWKKRWKSEVSLTLSEPHLCQT